MSKLTRKYGRKLSSQKILAVTALAGLAALGAGKAQAQDTPITPTLGDDASYTLTEVTTPTDNSITLYKYDNTGITEAVNYEVNLKTTEYGSGSKSMDIPVSLFDSNVDITVKYDDVLNQNSSVVSGKNEVVEQDILNATLGRYPNEEPLLLQGGSAYDISTDENLSLNNYLFKDNTMSYDTDIVPSTVPGNTVYNYVQVYGGAIYNAGTIDGLSSDFVNNTLSHDFSYDVNRYQRNFPHAFGGALHNDGIVNSINGNFTGNKVFVTSVSNNQSGHTELYSYGYGGAISNSATIGSITGNFYQNGIIANAYKNDSEIWNYHGGCGAGGALYNDGTIDSITGDFVENYIDGEIYDSVAQKGESVVGYGAAIYNSNVIGNITGNFISNRVNGSGSGVAINNRNTINNITGDFINNSAVDGSGGAIYNVAPYKKNAKISSINGSFIGNYLSGDSYKWGGAIYNSDDAEIDLINADFIGNYVKSNKDFAVGGAIYNNGTLGSITGDFIANYAEGYRSASGGAISTGYAKINSLTGDFVENYAKSANGSASGGAIKNYGYYDDDSSLSSRNSTITDLNADFIGNYAEGLTSAVGGAVSNDAIIKNVKGDFIANYAKSSNGIAAGGALSNSFRLGSVEGDFVGNYVESPNGMGQNELDQNLYIGAYGGAVANGGVIESMRSDFLGNKVKTGVGDALGGAFFNAGGYSNEGVTYQTTINGDFVYNSAESISANARGGAITNWSSGVFGYGQFFAMMAEMDVEGDLIQNNATSIDGNALGGAVYVHGVDYESIYAQMGGYGDVGDATSLPYIELLITNEDGSVYKSLALICDQNGNPVLGSSLEDAIANGTLKSFVKMESSPIPKAEFDAMCEQEGMTEEEYFAKMEQQFGGALVYGDPNDLLNELPAGVPSITIAAQSVESVRANKASVTLKNSNILNNYALSQNGKAQGGAIYTEFDTVKIEANNGEAHLISGNYTKNGDVIDDNAIYAKDSKVIFDVTNGSTIQLDDNINGKNYETYIIGDDSSRFILNNKIKNATTHLIDTNLYLTKDSHLDGNNLGLHSGTLNMINNQAGVSALNNLTVTGDTDVNVDVDLKNQTMDRFTASEYGSHSGNLNVTGMNLLSDAVSDNTEILFAEQGLKDNVTNGITTELPDSKYQSTVYTPIYKYNVAYDNREDGGYFVFARSGGDNKVDTFNPAVLGSSTSATVGAIGTMNQAFNYAFQHSADYMHIPYLERVSMKDRNKYALSITGDATDMGRFSPLYQPSDEGSSVWVKPYATFENVPLKNGPKVSNITYGTLVGFDSEMQSLRRGWDRVWTGYIGYNGASQRYSGIDSTQNGGLIGGTMTLYKGNFFNATTVSVGANVANNQTMYGNEDFAMLLSGIGNKTGYNFEFKEGKLILQPSMLMSYTFVNTFDYTNAAGVRIDNKPLHALQLAPGVKVIGNLKGGWQPYASVSMVWNLMGESDATANGVKLPEMSIKPYVQYGVGLQKRIKDHFMAYGQAMVQNGGRNGVSLTAGFRWALGHDCKYKNQKVDAKKQDKISLSNEILRSAQNDRGKSIRHSELDSESINANNNASALGVGGMMPRAAEHKKILKQMTPQQRAAYGGKYYNTSRTAKSGTLRQY